MKVHLLDKQAVIAVQNIITSHPDLNGLGVALDAVGGGQNPTVVDQRGAAQGCVSACGIEAP